MVNKYVKSMLCLSITLATPSLMAGTYSSKLCNEAEYECFRVPNGETWASLFPDENERMLVRKVNRMNTPVEGGMTIAVPRNLGNVGIMDLSPLPSQIPTSKGQNSIKVDLQKLAWGAYDENGQLVNWGPVSGGKDYCPDIHHGCRTPMGTYTFFDKQGPGCISHKFPIETHGGAHMPYCMHFHGGYALHGSATVPGENASHGCVRLFTEDAQWLNENFVNIGSTKVSITR